MIYRTGRKKLVSSSFGSGRGRSIHAAAAAGAGGRAERLIKLFASHGGKNRAPGCRPGIPPGPLRPAGYLG